MINISKLSKWPPFWGRDNFLTESCTENWICQHDSHECFWDILSFWSTLWLKCWWRYSNFKLLPTLWPGDVINYVRSTDLYKYSHNPMIPMYGKFNDDICVRFLVIMKDVLISFIKEYRAPTLRPPISEFKLNLCLIFQNLQNGRHFEVTRNFFTGSNTGSWIYHLSI